MTNNDIYSKLEQLREKIENSYSQLNDNHQNDIMHPTLDLSFMNTNPELINNKNSKEDTESSKEVERLSNTSIFPNAKHSIKYKFQSFQHSIRNVAAVFFILLFISSILVAVYDTPTVHALKFQIKKFFHETKNHTYSTEKSTDSDNNLISIQVSDETKLGTIQRQIPGLLLPEKLPSKFEFLDAQADIWINGEWEVLLHYTDSDQHFFYIKESYYKECAEFSLKMKAEKVPVSDGIAYYIEENENSRGLYYIKDELFINIFGNSEKETLLYIEENLM